MKLKKLTIQNIASIEHAEIDFDASPLCDEHLFLITGKTGSGKSTIIDCICLALYNSTPRLRAAANGNVKYAANRADDANQRTLSAKDPSQLLRRGTTQANITLTFDDNNGIPYVATWEVHRAYGKLDGAIRNITRELRTEDGVEKPYLEQRSEKINDHITELIGLDADQFFRTVVLPQGKFA